MKLTSQRDKFVLDPKHTYLNASYLGPTLKSLREAGAAFLEEKKYPWSYVPTDFITKDERIRGQLAQILHCKSENIALVSSVSYGVETAAKNIPLKKGQTVVLPEGDFPSDVYPWKEAAKRAGATLKFVGRPYGFDRTSAVLEMIDSSTAVVSVPPCDWIDGSRFDLEAISKAAKKVGAALCVDASQSLGAYPLDVRKFDPDFLFSVGYKWQLGPYGNSYLYVADRHFNGTPLENNWLGRKGCENFAKLTEYTDHYHVGARRFESGEHAPFLLAPLTAEALRQILEWGPENLNEYSRSLTTYLAEKVGALPFKTPDPKFICGHMMGIEPKRPETLEKIAAVCKARNVHVSVRATCVRVSPYIYNTREDIDTLVSAIEAAI